MAAFVPPRVVASVATACALAGCTVRQDAVREAVFGLQGVEEAAFAECRAPVHAKLCGARPDAEACWEEVKAKYAGLRDTVARKRFLIDSGCPSHRVEAWLPDPR